MLNPDYRDILSVFADLEIEYLVVGAYALAAHGNPRATGDIDLWVKPSSRNAVLVVEALRRFGAPAEHFSESDFEQPDVILQLGVTPRRIDILTSISGVRDFDEAWGDRLSVEIEGIAVPVIGREHLIANKRATGRPQDQVDVAWLEANEG